MVLPVAIEMCLTENVVFQATVNVENEHMLQTTGPHLTGEAI